MSRVKKNLYHIDGVLLGAGTFTGLLALLFSTAIGYEISRNGATVGLVLALGLIVGCPLAMLTTGWRVRRYEKRLVALWELVSRHGEISVAHLCDVFSMNRKQLRDAVRRINRRGSALLVVDEAQNVVHNGARQIQTLAHSQDCAKCGAKVAVEVRENVSDYACPYCGAGLDTRHINELRRQLRHPNTRRAPEPALSFASHGDLAQEKPFRLGLFVVLMFFFWPGAIAYAIWAHSR